MGRAPRRAAPCALALLAACQLSTEGGPVGGGGGTVPTATPEGLPQGPATVATIGEAGGELVVPGGAVRLTVPPGSVEGPTAFTATPVSSRAPGALGGTWRLEAGGPLAGPVRLVFRGLGSYRPGLGLPSLAVRFQDARGFWVAPAALERDAGADTLTVTTPHLSDWALVLAAPPALEGTFTYATTVGTPFTASGTAALHAWPDAAEPTWFLTGTATLPPALAVAGLTCVPDAATRPLDLSVAEVGAASFRWGLNARWALTCDDGTGALSSHEVATDFDTLGITHHGCSRRYLGTQVTGAAFVQGGYLIDCGAAGQVAATWDFRGCAAGAACVPADPCLAGEVACSQGLGTCVAGAPLPPGTPCGDGLACDDAGACLPPP